MKYKRLASKLGVKKFEPGALISKMHSIKGMPKAKKHKSSPEPDFKKHKFGTEKGLAKPFEKKHKEVDFKKHKACMKKHKHDKSCE
jgi:hypothetical protein